MMMPASTPTAETRARILQAAETLFAAKGYAATAVHEITSAAGVNRALLYYYFTDKHSLYQAVLDQGVAAFNAMLDRTLHASGSYAERLQAFLAGHLKLAWESGEVLRVVHRCLLDGYQEEFKLVERFSTCVGQIERFLREGIASGEFRELDPAITARALIGPSMAFSLWRISGKPPCCSQEELIEQITQLVLRGVVAAPSR